MAPRIRRALWPSSRVNNSETALDIIASAQPVLLLDAFMGYVSTFFHELRYEPMAALSSAGSQDGPSMCSSHQAHPRRPWLHDARRHRIFSQTPRRQFHNYFVTHLPSSSLHPDSRSSSGPHHKLPRSASTPHTQGPGSSPAVVPPNMPSRDLTVVRIPLRSAKHHFGAYSSRGSRGYNEDTSQAGTINMPAFAKRVPISLSAKRGPRSGGEGTSADSSFGDPQIFYFGVFDGHGGSECSEFLRDELQGYIEAAAANFGLRSSLRRAENDAMGQDQTEDTRSLNTWENPTTAQGHQALNRVQMKSGEEVKAELSRTKKQAHGDIVDRGSLKESLESEEALVPENEDVRRALLLEEELVDEYKSTVGGYFRRFKPSHFGILDPRARSSTDDPDSPEPEPLDDVVSLESVLTYAFLRADLDFVTAQARKPDPDDPYVSDFPLNQDEVLGRPHLAPSGQGIGGPARFKGGSTASIALISTPTAAPFWHPAAHSTLAVAHVGDTRVLLCETASGVARPLTSDHHPSSPAESRRLRRFASGSLVTDSFGEERISGLANSRAFGDMRGKRVGVSAEPEVGRVELGPAEYSFLVLVSDGVSGTLSDQEIVDVIKEARTPEQGARAVVEYATEVSSDGDNATCLVVRLGGWERRSEGGVGSLGTKEIRDARRAEALDPRRGRR